ncbi:MAG: hypothetical protein COB30_006565 [Ectothiorhodospiraceae bacterium]|nr:hypothetical protein [Ectothiorhodospiraceae bacterium]
MDDKLTLTDNECPFCRSNSTHVLSLSTKPNTSSHAKGYQVECVDCGARGPCGMATPKDAMNAWAKGDTHYKQLAEDDSGKVSKSDEDQQKRLRKTSIEGAVKAVKLDSELVRKMKKMLLKYRTNRI